MVDDVIYNTIAREAMTAHGVAINDLHALTTTFDEDQVQGTGRYIFYAEGECPPGRDGRGGGRSKALIPKWRSTVDKSRASGGEGSGKKLLSGSRVLQLCGRFRRETCIGGGMKFLAVGLALIGVHLTVLSATTLYEGTINGAPYAVAVPTDWTAGKVFFHVHGWRPATSPHEANLDLEDPLYQKLLAAGWVIGRTAFWENGVDHDAHTLALRDLKAWIEIEIGPIEMLILEGESTAGTLVLRIAEQDPDLADGVIALGPFIDLNDTELDTFVTAKPRLPAVLLTNISEILDDLEYVTTGAAMDTPLALRPVLRPGHMNMNWLERWKSFLALEASLTGGEPLSFANGTYDVPARETGTETLDDGLVNAVTAVNVYYGNAILGFHPAELTAAGISQGDYIDIEAGGKTWSVLYGVTYGDVDQGEWVAFPTADDIVLLVRYHESAIETADLSVGDRVKIMLP